MATYICELDQGQQIYIENQGVQTAIALVSSGPGQQQSQRNSFETGNWRVPPTGFRTPSGVVLQISAEQGQHFIQVQANGMTRLNSAPSLSNADVLPLRQVDEAVSRNAMPDMQPMEPMKPMPPMQISDMEMRMGSMEMRMGKPLRMQTAPKQGQLTKNFCSQCGSKVEIGDYFCSHCGNSLAPSEG